MNKMYINQYGVRIEEVETNKDVFGNVYVTWKFSDTDTYKNTLKESFKTMLKANGYKEMK